ncbi:MAG: hypothetical protein ABH836_01690 [Candidatus Omnitrophota bacterium]
MYKQKMDDKELSDISDVISKYARRRLYKTLRDKIEKSDLEPAAKIEIAKKDYTLSIDEKAGIFFGYSKKGDKYPIVFSLEDLESGQKNYLLFSDRKTKAEIFRSANNELILIRFDDKVLKIEIVLEPKEDHLIINGRVKSNSQKIVRIGIELQIDAVGWNWHKGVRDVCAVEEGNTYYLLGKDYKLGKNGKIPYYPFGNLSNDDVGFVLGVNPQEPRIFEISYDARQKHYQLFFDMAITSKTKNFPNEANFSAFLLCLKEEDRNTGFRTVLKKYYQLFPEVEIKRVEKEGNWMPFYNIAGVEKAEDFCFAYHELNIFYDGTLRSKVNIDYNVSGGIYNFVYTEPWLAWVHMPKDMERTYDTLLDFVKASLNSEDEKIREFASAVLCSAIKDSEGKYYVRFADAPWCCGAVFNTNTDPAIKTGGMSWVNRAQTVLRQVIRSMKDPRFHGIYLDSMQSVELTHDYDETHFETTEFPLTFEKDKKMPVVCQFISAYHLTELLADYLHSQGKLLMANFPAAFTFFMQHIDVPGEEIGWIESGQYKPVDEEELIMRRALSCKRPYVFLQSVNFDEFTKDMVDKYMQKCLFYGMFPGMFSFNAQDASYWENPSWYNRDRELFKKYMPHIINLSKAGWEPITDAALDNKQILIEQFGKSDRKDIYITCFNQSADVQNVRLDLSKFARIGAIEVSALVDDKNYSFNKEHGSIDLKLDSNEVRVFKINR